MAVTETTLRGPLRKTGNERAVNSCTQILQYEVGTVSIDDSETAHLPVAAASRSYRGSVPTRCRAWVT